MRSARLSRCRLLQGEYHFEMKATCNVGVSMETGFHVEVE